MICCNKAKVLWTLSSTGDKIPKPPSAVPTIRQDLLLHFLSNRAPKSNADTARADDAMLLRVNGGGGGLSLGGGGCRGGGGGGTCIRPLEGGSEGGGGFGGGWVDNSR